MLNRLQFAKALAAIDRYDREKFTHGTDRIRLYFDDVDGDWLDLFESDRSDEDTEKNKIRWETK